MEGFLKLPLLPRVKFIYIGKSKAKTRWRDSTDGCSIQTSQNGNKLGCFSFQAGAIASRMRGRCVRNGRTLPRFQNVFVIDPERKNGKYTKFVKTAYEIRPYILGEAQLQSVLPGCLEHKTAKECTNNTKLAPETPQLRKKVSLRLKSCE